MALVITVPGTVSGVHKKFKVDPILPDNGGAVWLVDPTHPANPWAAGVPANASAIPNIVAAQPSLGVPALQSANGGPLALNAYQDGNLTGALGKMERTGKGGLHTIISQTPGSTDLATHAGSKYYLAIRSPLSLLPNVATPGNNALNGYFWGTNGLDGAYAHAYFLSLWVRVTRSRVAGTQATFAASLVMSSAYSGGFNVAAGGASSMSGTKTSPNTSANTSLAGASQLLGATSVGNDCEQVASTTKYVNPANAASELRTNLVVSAWDTGNANPFIPGTAKGNAGSQILYRSYLEDLTVSGRTYAQVKALDDALYAKEVLTFGGRYYGDTFTDPATIV